MGKHVSANILANTWHEESRERVIEAEWAVHLFYRTCYGFENVEPITGSHVRKTTPLYSWYLGKVFATGMGFYSVSCNDVNRVPGE